MQSDQTTKTSCTISESRDGGNIYVLDPANHDRFVRTGKQVIEHCQLAVSVEMWFRDLQLLLGQVAEWCNQQGGRVRACYAVPAAKVMLFFIPASESYDFVLGAELADLNVRLVRDFNVGMVETRQIPWDDRDRFFNEETSRKVYEHGVVCSPAGAD